MTISSISCPLKILLLTPSSYMPDYNVRRKEKEREREGESSVRRALLLEGKIIRGEGRYERKEGVDS